MKTKIRLFNKEAYLYDSGLFILKAFVAVLSAYAIVQRLPLVHKDMISMLFGLMMTLEPVTVTGIRSGMKQLTATLLGALVSAVIIYFFGINVGTVSLAVAATLYICLLINWREVSPVAIFTSIYMTNYVQYTASGEPSISLTFLLRILALGSGIVIAVFFNLIFSLFFYQRMENKRIIHILTSIKEHMVLIKSSIENRSLVTIVQVKDVIPETFKRIDWLTALIIDRDKENNIKKRLKLDRGSDPAIYHKVLEALRTITHLLNDTTYIISSNLEQDQEMEQRVINLKLEELIRECDYLAMHYGNDRKPFVSQSHTEENKTVKLTDIRLYDNLNSMKLMLDTINYNVFQEGK